MTPMMRWESEKFYQGPYNNIEAVRGAKDGSTKSYSADAGVAPSSNAATRGSR
jgi:hypothetical protein